MSDDLINQQAQKAARVVPDHIWKLTQHYHDFFEIKKHWEANGIPCPPAFNKELQRAHDALLDALDAEWNQGGEYHKSAKEKRNDARQSE